MCNVVIHSRPRMKSNLWGNNNENSPLKWSPSWGTDSTAEQWGSRTLRPVYGNRVRVLFDRRSRSPSVNYCRNFRNSIRFFFFYFWHRPAGTRPVRPTRQNAYVTRVPTPWRRRNYCFTAKRHVRIYCPANNYRSFSPPIRPTWTGGRSRAEYTRKRVGSEHATWPLGTPPNVVIFLISVKDACEIYRHRCYRVVTELLRTHYYVSLSFFMSRPMAQSVSCGTIIFETCNLRD